MTKNAYFGPNLAVFWPKILIFMGVSRSFGTRKTKKTSRQLFSNCFWSGVGSNCHCNCLPSTFLCWQFWQYLQLFQQLSTSSLSTLASFYHWSTGLKLHHLSIVSIFGFTKRRQIAQKKFARFAKKGPLQHEKNWCGWSTTTKLQISHKKIRQGYARSSLPKKKMNSWKRFRLSLYQKEHTCIAYV